jgi:hypothetical protein
MMQNYTAKSGVESVPRVTVGPSLNLNKQRLLLAIWGLEDFNKTENKSARKIKLKFLSNISIGKCL